jgi:uncharacterized protein YbaP (TraB family)
MRNILIIFCLFIYCFPGVDAQTKYPNTLLWEINRKDLAKPSYLFGTFHINHKEVFNLNDSVLSKLLGCDAFANEVNMDSLTDLIKDVVESDTKELKVKQLLNEEELTRLDEFLKKKAKTSLKEMGNPTSNQVYMTISKFKKSKGEMDTFLDGWLYNIARNNKKRIFGIEDAKADYDLLKKYPESDQKELILSVIDSSDMVTGFETQMLNNYTEENLNGLNDIINTKSSEYFSEMLINDRNKNMIGNMEKIMKDQSCFFAVGAAHLPGEKGLISLLEKDGYSVTPVIAPKTGFYKKFITENSTAEWARFSDNESGFSVEMPGKPGLINQSGLQMHAYYDAGTGKIFLAFGAPTLGKINSMDPDDVSKYFENRLRATGKTSNKHAIEYKGMKGVEMDAANDELVFRMRVLYNSENAYVFMEGSAPNKKVKYDEKYFNSVEFIPVVENKYIPFSSDTDAFTIIAPDNIKLTTKKTRINLNQRIFTGTDRKLKVSVSVIVTDYGYGRYFDDADKLFKTLKNKDDSSFHVFSFNGLPGRIIEKYSDDKYSKTIYILNGSRLYAIVGEATDTSSKDKVEFCMGSFHFLSYKNTPMESFNSDKEFSILAPPEKHIGSLKEKNDEDENEDKDDIPTSYFYFLDPLCSSPYNVIREGFKPYYYAGKEDSVYLNSMIRRIYPEDSIIYSQIERLPYCITLTSKILFTKNPTFCVHSKIVVTGNYIYTLSTYQLTNSGDSTANVFLNSFELKNKNRIPEIFSSRLALLLKDLHDCSDSVNCKDLKNQLIGYSIDQPDTSILKEWVTKKYFDNESGLGKTNHRIYSKLFEAIKDSASAADFAERNYESFADDDYLKLLFLSHISASPSVKNYSFLKKMLLRDRPFFNQSGNKDADLTYQYLLSNVFGQLHSDSNFYSLALYPEILELQKSKYYSGMVLELTEALLADSILKPGDIDFSRKEIKNMISEEVSLMLNDTMENEYNYSASLSNGLKILSYFHDDSVVNICKKIISSRLYAHYENALYYLAKMNVHPDESALLKYLDSPLYRYETYNLLNAAGKINWYPAKYLAQKYFAESDLYGILNEDNEDQEAPDKIVYVSTIPVKFKGAEKIIYAYKIYYTDEDSKPLVYSAWAGPYSATTSPLQVEHGELTGTNYKIWDENLYKKEILDEANKSEAE